MNTKMVHHINHPYALLGRLNFYTSHWDIGKNALCECVWVCLHCGGIGSQASQSVSRPISTGYVSAVLRLRHTSRADRFHFSLCVNPNQV